MPSINISRAPEFPFFLSRLFPFYFNHSSSTFCCTKSKLGLSVIVSRCSICSWKSINIWNGVPPSNPPKIFIQNKSTTKNPRPTTLIYKANSHKKHISHHIHKSIIVSLPSSGHPTLEQSIFSWLLIFQQKMFLQFLVMYSFIQNKFSISLISLLSFIFDCTLNCHKQGVGVIGYDWFCAEHQILLCLQISNWFSFNLVRLFIIYEIQYWFSIPPPPAWTLE